MSHVAAVNIVVHDLDELKAAGERIGFEFIEHQKTHKWYGTWLNDWHNPRAASMKGVDPKTFGSCDHALRLKSRIAGDYEVGVTQQEDGTYRLVYDSYGQGHRLELAGGRDMLWLSNEVAAEAATRTLQRKGWRVSREQATRDQIRLRAEK